jgi:acetyl-CoA carboxylase biotin carboxyl carrier protein
MPNKFDLDIDAVRKLAKLLDETGLSEIEYAEGDRRIRCVGKVAQTMQFAPAPAAVTAPVAAAAPAADAKPQVSGTVVTSPMVGTVYLASAPGSAPFIKVGDKVKQGDTLLIIEAMKVMNPIKAPKGGTVVQIAAEDSKPVEFGETLVVID